MGQNKKKNNKKIKGEECQSAKSMDENKIEEEKLLAEGKEPIEYTSHRKERYFFGNKEVDLDSISKESAEKAKKINKSKPSDIFQVDINNILALGKEW